ncbi:hypothetical protein O181_033190 [Austropuccinia psidii MF-1]|uniref:Integrase catalytic domain-containing protein n=1 Tax=Austropuccinia psidii MF-1 TaxID=1389203 RepID=A0A9Q3D2K2_9BASI|nr:hypothetical protein [Austropuccinia psidii MF-1]
MIKIQEPWRPLEIVHMSLVTGLPPGFDTSYISCLVIVERLSKALIFLPCHKDDKSMCTAPLIWNRVVSWTGTFTNIVSNRDTKITSPLWTNIHKLFGNKLSFSTAYHPQTDGLAQRIIQTLEDMVRSVCEYGLELKDCDGFNHKLVYPSPCIELEYKTTIQASTNKTPVIIERILVPR